MLVLEPRRLAARLAARFVAAERGEPVGETVGYQVRFEEVAGPRTRLRFLTEGVLTRRLLSDPHLERVGCVVLDEFHERHLEGDLALALLRRLQRTAPARSAPGGDVGHARCRAGGGIPGRRARDALRGPAVSAGNRVHAALRRAARRAGGGRAGAAAAGAPAQGHVLVFLPGAAEIRRAQTACAALAAASRLAACCRCTAINRPKSRTAPCGPRDQPQNHPLHQRGRKLHHHRRRQRGDR